MENYFIIVKYKWKLGFNSFSQNFDNDNSINIIINKST